MEADERLIASEVVGRKRDIVAFCMFLECAF